MPGVQKYRMVENISLCVTPLLIMPETIYCMLVFFASETEHELGSPIAIGGLTPEPAASYIYRSLNWATLPAPADT